MCGIAGFSGRGDSGVLKAMTDALAHRGPDAEGLWEDVGRGLWLGHRRLAIVDLSGGAQPMWTPDGALGVVFNGEIYNHQDLRTELKGLGHVFETDHSDTEVLLHAYRQWGDAFVERLSGMWAFVLYDRARQRLFGSRDRFGKKPLYYFHEGDTFGFASELPALLRHPSAPRQLSPVALQKYFAYCFIPAPRSAIERVWKLPGGYSFGFDLRTRRLEVRRYWEFTLEPDPRLLEGGERTLDALCEEIRAVLDRAVERRLMADVPLGVFLSGGIDSSAVAALAAKRVPAGSLNTFSIGFRDPSFDESSHARFVAEQLGTRHREEILDLEKASGLLPEILSRLDEPLGDSSLLPTTLLSRFTRQHVTVALGGDGADELFAGYDPFRALGAAELYTRWMPRPAHEALRMIAGKLPVSHANVSLDFKVKRTLMGLSYPPPLWNAVWMSALEPSAMGDLFANPLPPEELYSEAIDAWESAGPVRGGAGVVDRSLQFWTRLYLQDGILAKVDRASMQASLEARSPFLDLEFVNLARRIPHTLKLRGGVTKWILKRALAPLLPRQIIERPKKGFGMPIGRWLREDGFAAHPAAPFVSRPFVEQRIADHRAGRADERLLLWCHWVLSQWKP
jgi:asparagine synthase (glutamine-hydrolysing)